VPARGHEPRERRAHRLRPRPLAQPRLGAPPRALLGRIDPRAHRTLLALALAVLLSPHRAAAQTPLAGRADSLAATPEPIADTTARAPRAARLPPWATALARPDRLQHGSLSFTIAAGIGLLSRPRGEAFGVTLGLGVVKELLDSRRDRFDPGDLAADAAGAALGAWACRGP